MNRFFLGSLVVIVTLVLASCSTMSPIEDEDLIGHVISIGRDGELERISPGKEIKLDPGEGLTNSYEASFAPIFNGIRTYPKDAEGNINVVRSIN